MSNKSLFLSNESQIKSSNLYKFFDFNIDLQKQVKLNNYSYLHDWSCKNSEIFWSKCLNNLDIYFQGDSSIVIEDSKQCDFFLKNWFPNSKINYAFNLLKGSKNLSKAIIGFDEQQRFIELSGNELSNCVANFQKILIENGLVKNDVVAGIVPNSPEAIIAMLAVTSLGAIWTSCSPDFGVNGILDRFTQVNPKFLISCDGYNYNGKTYFLDDKLLKIKNEIKSFKAEFKIPFLSSNREESIFLNKTIKNKVNFNFDLAFSHPLFIMYSSGTTGKPKCMVHGHGGTLVQHKKEHMLHGNLKKNDSLFYFTTCGWMMWNWMVSALACGGCVYTYEGSPIFPNKFYLFEVLANQKINFFGTSPKYLSLFLNEKKEKFKTINFDSLHTVYSTGAPLVDDHYQFFYKYISSPSSPKALYSISGGTDIISCFILGNILTPINSGFIQGPGLGMNVKCYDEKNNQVFNKQGELVCVDPFVSMPIYFFDDDNYEKYSQAYFTNNKNFWSHGDFITQTPDLQVIVHGRSDSTLNPSGVRIGTAEIYRTVESIPDVVDSLAVGYDFQGNEVIILFIKLLNNFVLNDALIKVLKNSLKKENSPRHIPRLVLQVTDIPYTISGKKVEKAVKKLISNQKIKNRSALQNPECLEQYENFNIEKLLIS